MLLEGRKFHLELNLKQEEKEGQSTVAERREVKGSGTRVWRGLEWRSNQLRAENLSSDAYRVLDVWEKNLFWVFQQLFLSAGFVLCKTCLTTLPEVHCGESQLVTPAVDTKIELRKANILWCFWLEILWVIGNPQAPSSSSIAKSSKEWMQQASIVLQGNAIKHLPERQKQTQQEGLWLVKVTSVYQATFLFHIHK